MRAASSSLSRLRRLPIGSQITLADMTPHRVAMNARGDEVAELLGLRRFSSTCTRPMTVPMMPMVGA